MKQAHVLMDDGIQYCVGGTPPRRKRGTRRPQTVPACGCIVCGLPKKICDQFPICCGKNKYSNLSPADHKTSQRAYRRWRRKHTQRTHNVVKEQS